MECKCARHSKNMQAYERRKAEIIANNEKKTSKERVLKKTSSETYIEVIKPKRTAGQEIFSLMKRIGKEI